MKHIFLIFLSIISLNYSYAQTSDRYAFNFSVSPGFHPALTIGKTAYPGPYVKPFISAFTEAGLTVKNKNGYFCEAGLGFSVLPYIFGIDDREVTTGLPQNQKFISETWGSGIYMGLNLKAGKSLGKYEIALGIMPVMVFRNTDSLILSGDTTGSFQGPVDETTFIRTNEWSFNFTGEVRRSIGHTKNGVFKAGIFVSYSLRPLLKGYYIYNALPEPNRGEIKAFPHFAGIKITYSFSRLW